jgi:hypothetical protein
MSATSESVIDTSVLIHEKFKKMLLNLKIKKISQFFDGKIPEVVMKTIRINYFEELAHRRAHAEVSDIIKPNDSCGDACNNVCRFFLGVDSDINDLSKGYNPLTTIRTEIDSISYPALIRVEVSRSDGGEYIGMHSYCIYAKNKAQIHIYQAYADSYDLPTWLSIDENEAISKGFTVESYLETLESLSGAPSEFRNDIFKYLYRADDEFTSYKIACRIEHVDVDSVLENLKSFKTYIDSMIEKYQGIDELGYEQYINLLIYQEIKYFIIEEEISTIKAYLGIDESYLISPIIVS